MTLLDACTIGVLLAYRDNRIDASCVAWWLFTESIDAEGDNPVFDDALHALAEATTNGPAELAREQLLGILDSVEAAA